MSQMKFVSSAENCVKDMLKGLSRIYSDNYIVDEVEKVIYYKKAKDPNVKILSGGGSGHEPFCAGFIGDGMLSAGVAGDVFASPPSSTIFHAICTLASNNDNNGILVVIMNYTGDVLNFGLAIEKAKFRDIRIESVIVDEDCSKFDDENFTVRRRGMSGGVLVMKIAGAMASGGCSLIEIKKTCDDVIAKLGSIGACVTSCTVPGVGTLFELSTDEMEVGVGVHGEAGAFRSKLLPVKRLISIMLEKIFSFLRIETDKRTNVCVLINNLGAVSQLELSIIANEVCAYFDNNTKVEICRLFVGPFMSSLDMAGFQICVLNVTGNSEWLTYLDYETDAPAWPKSIAFIPVDQRTTLTIKHELSLASEETECSEIGIRLNESMAILFKTCLKTCADVLIRNKDRLNELDKAVGDGDTGTTLSNLCANVLENIDSFRVDYPRSCFLQLSEIAQNKMGGTSGALYSLAFTAAAEYFKQTSEELLWHRVYSSIIRSLTKYSTAELGDRTMLDVLLPVHDEYKSLVRSNCDEMVAFTKSVSLARQKLQETCYMTPKVGRASYVSRDLIKSEDAGAYAIVLILEGIRSVLSTE